MARVKEILVYHHSHFDIGYTHTQPILWQLQKGYMDQALDLCELTEHEPEDRRFYWTCETTGQLLNWLETASQDEIDRLIKYVRNGQICIAALNMHTTPLCDADQLARMMYPVKALRDRFGISVKTAINHDVNGQPWTFAQILLDAGIEFYTTAINPHFGGVPLKRPAAFNWQAPDGRQLLTYLGKGYGFFTWICRLWEKDVSKMKRALDDYIDLFENQGYDSDFLYVSATNMPVGDNSPPDWELLEMINKYNAEGYEQKIRMVTPDMLLDRLRRLPKQSIPTYAGDWTDYWNFGAASTADETRLNRRAKAGLKSAEFLAAVSPELPRKESILFQQAWDQANLFEEHTWGAAGSISNPDSLVTKQQWMHKAHNAFQANSLSHFLLTKQLEKFAANPPQSGTPQGVLIVNPTYIEQTHDLRLPKQFTQSGRHVASIYYMNNLNNDDINWSSPVVEKVVLPPFGYKMIPIEQLVRPTMQTSDIAIAEGLIETPFYRLAYNAETGAITEFIHKQTGWKMFDDSGDWSFFQFVHESIDPLKNKAQRSSIYLKIEERTSRDLSCWHNDWKAIRKGAHKLVSLNCNPHDSGVTLEMVWEAPGVNKLVQKITLFIDRPEIECTALLDKLDIREPEAIYFAFPLQLDENWEAVFDSAGTFVRLDEDQLPGSCRDYITADQTVSVFDRRNCLTVACPDAPLFQIGDFYFGKEQKQIPRGKNPLLLGWPLNNYWDTNFKASQPGIISIKYVLFPHRSFEAEAAARLGVLAGRPPQLFPVVNCSEIREGKLLDIQGEGLVPVAIKPAEDGAGMIIRLHNLNQFAAPLHVRLPESVIQKAFQTDIFEQNVQELNIEAGELRTEVAARQLITIRILKRGQLYV